MQLIQEQKLLKYLSFRDYISQNPLVLEAHKHLISDYNSFLINLNIILKTKEMIDDSNKSDNIYIILREDLIKTTLSVSRKVTAYLLLEEMTEYQGLFCYTYDELAQGNDDTLLKKSGNLFSFISKWYKELAEYSINDSLKNKFHDLLEQFSLVIENKRLNEKIEIQKSDHFTQLFRETDEIFEKKLTKLSESILSRPT